MYCVPGVTAERCRGTFWETGKLYEKGQEGGPYTPAEYTTARSRVRELRSLLGDLKQLADEGDVKQVGEVAATARAELRQVGERLARSLAGDERIDSERRLFAVVRALDDLDVATLRSDLRDADSKAAPGFTRVSLLLTQAAGALDEFMRNLPDAPDDLA